MRASKLFYLLKKHNIPHDVKVMSDSGWECGETDVDGIYYSKKQNVIILTQEPYVDGDYSEIENYIEHQKKYYDDLKYLD